MNVTFQTLEKEWHFAKNGDLTLSMFSHGSDKKVWWICSKSCLCGLHVHEWEARIGERMRGSGCPHCSKHYSVKPHSCQTLEARYPLVSKKWHPTKNGTISPLDVYPESAKQYWWICNEKCACGMHVHEWKAGIREVVQGSGCPFCSHKSNKPLECESLQAKHPTIASEWHPHKNIGISPNEFYPVSGKKVWWLCQNKCSCGNHPHEWKATIAHRTSNNRGCPFCTSCSKVPLECESVAIQSPNVAEQWHPQKNGELLPKHFYPNSDAKIWWLCPNTCKCGLVKHEWVTQVKVRVRGNGCPFCSKSNSKPLCKCESLEGIHPNIAKQWHPEKNGSLKPSDVTPGSQSKVWWLCNMKCNCGNHKHEWKSAVYSRIKTVCPFCTHKTTKPLPCENVAYKFPHLINEYHQTLNGDDSLKDFYPGSSKRVWWICNKGHEWQTAIANRCKMNGTNCRICSSALTYSKKSLQWLSYLELRYKNIQHALNNSEYKIPNSRYFADGYDPDSNTVFEFHGDFWHGNPKKYNADCINPITQTTFGVLYEKTMTKRTWILSNGYNYVECWEDDWNRATHAVYKIQRKYRDILKSKMKT